MILSIQLIILIIILYLLYKNKNIRIENFIKEISHYVDLMIAVFKNE